MFGVDIIKSYTVTTCSSRTPDFVSHISARTYGFLGHRPKRPEFEARQLDSFEACGEGLFPPSVGQQRRNLDTLPRKVSSRQARALGQCPSISAFFSRLARPACDQSGESGLRSDQLMRSS